MLEHAGEEKRKRTLFLNEIITQQLSDLFRDISARIINDYEFDNGSIEELFPDYFTGNKKLGRAIDEEGLMMLSAVCLAYLRTESIPAAFKLDAAELGASALREAAFLQTVESHNSLETVDERLATIAASDTMLEAAQRFVAPDSERYHRLALQRAFTVVYNDVVSGEVTMDTVAEINEKLTERLLATYDIKEEEAAQAQGLAGEIHVMRYHWQQYSKEGHQVTLPTTIRGGSGRENREHTHDLDVIRQRRDHSWMILPPIEVKSGRKITPEVKQRYTGSRLAHVSLKGEVTITSDHRKLTA